MRRSIKSIQLFLFILLIGTLTLRSVRIGDYQSYPAIRNRLTENARLLVDIIGNWNISQSRIANNQYPTYFDEYRINWNITIFEHPIFELIGNGVLDFNLTANNKEIELYSNQSLLFHWMDFGEITDATYIGVVLGMRTDSGEINQIYIGKQFYGNFVNQSKALLKFASPIIPLGQYWEQWGIELGPFFSYWSTETLTLVDIMYIHQVTISYHGPRFVRYSQPLVVDRLPPFVYEYPFLGLVYYQPEEPSTSQTTTSQFTKESSTSQTTTTQFTEEPSTSHSTLTQIPLITFGFSWIVSIILLSIITLHRLKKKKEF